jgi:hypothetical protein
MILWKSLHIEVYRDTHGQASASGDDDQNALLPGSWMISRGVPRRMRRPPMIVYPNPVGLFSGPVVQGRQVSLGGAPTALPRKRRAHHQRRASGEPSCRGVDHLRADDGS